MHNGNRPSNTIGTLRRVVAGFLAASIAVSIATVVLTAREGEPSVHVAHGVLPRTATGTARLAETRTRSVESTDSPTSTTSTPPPPPAPLEDTTLLQPVDVPAPGVTAPIQVIGRIRIPKLRVDVELRDQITQESIDIGPSHWPGTAAPGGFGNAVIAGHRNSHSAPFRDLGNLGVGDTIELVTAAGRTFSYAITETFVVDPSAMWITEQSPGHTLTLFTCHPLGSSSQRLVVHATLV